MKSSGAERVKPRRMRVTLRDLQILVALLTARYLTTDQLMKLFWPIASRGGKWGRLKACQQRMRLLHAHGLVRRIEQPVKRGENRPYIYALDRKGAELLIFELGTDPEEVVWRPQSQEANHPLMTHLLATTDFRIALLQACEQTGIVLEEWLDEKVLRSSHNVDHVTIVGPHGGETRTAVIPDAYFRLCRDEKRSVFFLEVDLKSVTIAPSLWERRGWMRRIRAYVAYFKSEAYQTKYGEHRARVLTVTTGRVRLENLKKATERVFEELKNAGEDTSDRNRFWFALLDAEAEPAALLTQELWHVAGSEKRYALLG